MVPLQYITDRRNAVLEIMVPNRPLSEAMSFCPKRVSVLCVCVCVSCCVHERNK